MLSQFVQKIHGAIWFNSNLALLVNVWLEWWSQVEEVLSLIPATANSCFHLCRSNQLVIDSFESNWFFCSSLVKGQSKNLQDFSMGASRIFRIVKPGPFSVRKLSFAIKNSFQRKHRQLTTAVNNGPLTLYNKSCRRCSWWSFLFIWLLCFSICSLSLSFFLFFSRTFVGSDWSWD